MSDSASVRGERAQREREETRARLLGEVREAAGGWCEWPGSVDHAGVEAVDVGEGFVWLCRAHGVAVERGGSSDHWVAVWVAVGVPRAVAKGGRSEVREWLARMIGERHRSDEGENGGTDGG